MDLQYHCIGILTVMSYFIGCCTEHVKRPLEEYMAQYPKVKIVRLAKREGLIRARLLGLKHVTAPTVTYLDSHCECAEGTCKLREILTSVVGQVTNRNRIIKAFFFLYIYIFFYSVPITRLGSESRLNNLFQRLFCHSRNI